MVLEVIQNLYICTNEILLVLMTTKNISKYNELSPFFCFAHSPVTRARYTKIYLSKLNVLSIYNFYLSVFVSVTIDLNYSHFCKSNYTSLYYPNYNVVRF